MRQRSLMYQRHLQAWVEMMRAREAAEVSRTTSEEPRSTDEPSASSTRKADDSSALPSLDRLNPDRPTLEGAREDHRLATAATGRSRARKSVEGGGKTKWSALSECGLGEGGQSGVGMPRAAGSGCRTWNGRTTPLFGLQGGFVELLSHFGPWLSHRERDTIPLTATVYDDFLAGNTPKMQKLYKRRQNSTKGEVWGILVDTPDAKLKPGNGTQPGCLKMRGVDGAFFDLEFLPEDDVDGDAEAPLLLTFIVSYASPMLQDAVTHPNLTSRNPGGRTESTSVNEERLCLSEIVTRIPSASIQPGLAVKRNPSKHSFLSMSQSSTIGILGLGIIGSRVAANLRQAGHHVHVWSHTARAVPDAKATPRAVAEAAKIIQIFVRDDEALLQAIRNMQPALTPDHIILNHATVSKAATLEAAKLVAEGGATFLDAPFTGSKMAAQNGKLVYYIGGSAEVLERVRPILEISSSKILPLGEIGDAIVLKIVTNLVSSITVKALAEAAAITHSQGIPLPKLLTALENNANFSTLVGMKLPTIISGDFEAHFSLRNMLKDADFARDLAAQSGLLTPALDCTAEAMRAGVRAGQGDLDFSVIGQV